MKKSACLYIIIFPALLASFLWGLFLPVKVQAESAEDLYTAEYTLTVDEALSHVEANLVLVNRGGSLLRAEVPLPVLSNGIKAETLSLKASKEVLLSEDLRLYPELGPDEILTLSYSYDTAASLVNATAIAADFRELVHREGGRIGHFRIDLRLLERDIPLVQDIVPANYTLRDSLLSLELYDFAVSNLAPSFCLTKESWRGLLGSREYDPNEEQRRFLNKAEEAFKDPDAIRLNLEEAVDPYPLYGQFMGLSDKDQATEAYIQLIEGTYSFSNIFSYLTAREIRKEKGTGIGDKYDVLSLLFLRYTTKRPPLLEEYIRQILYDGSPVMTAVLFSREPTLEGATLCTTKTGGDDWSRVEFTPGDELAIVRTVPIGFNYAGFWPDAYRFRHILISEDTGFSPGELSDYLLAIGAEVLIRQMLLDNRDGKWDYMMEKDGDTVFYPYGLFSCTSSGNLSRDTLYEAIYDTSSYMQNSFKVFERDDPLLSELPVPGFTRYWGVAREYQGVTQALDLAYGSYISNWYGVGSLPEILKKPEVREMKAERDSLHQDALQTVSELLDQKKEAAVPVSVSEVPEDFLPEEPESEPAPSETVPDGDNPSGPGSQDGEQPENESTADSEKQDEGNPGKETEKEKTREEDREDDDTGRQNTEQNRKARTLTALFLTAVTLLLAVIFVVLLLFIRTKRKEGTG